MYKWKIYTPDGVQDILGSECYLKREIEKTARDIFKSRGFSEIETPTIEFYDVFSSGKNIISQESMFKFFDQDGRILALRPDMTVPVARVYATKFKERKKPLLFSYIGNTFKYKQSGGGRQNEYTQAGVEIIGAKGPSADAEVVATAIELVLSTGLKEFQIDIGQVDFFKGLVEEAGFSEDKIEEIRDAIDTKDYLGLEEMMKEKEINDGLKELILSLPGLFGSVDVIEEVEKLNLNECSRNALYNLKSILNILSDYGYDDYVSVDLGMVPTLDYYTGMIFRGFTYGVGFPILSGGRYDNLIATYGEPTYATGFSAGINMLMTAIRRQGIEFNEGEIDYLVCYEEGSMKFALDKVKELRNEGKQVQIDVLGFTLEEAKEYCLENNILNLIYIKQDNEVNIIELRKPGGDK